MRGRAWHGGTTSSTQGSVSVSVSPAGRRTRARPTSARPVPAAARPRAAGSRVAEHGEHERALQTSPSNRRRDDVSPSATNPTISTSSTGSTTRRAVEAAARETTSRSPRARRRCRGEEPGAARIRRDPEHEARGRERAQRPERCRGRAPRRWWSASRRAAPIARPHERRSQNSAPRRPAARAGVGVARPRRSHLRAISTGRSRNPTPSRDRPCRPPNAWRRDREDGRRAVGASSARARSAADPGPERVVGHERAARRSSGLAGRASDGHCCVAEAPQPTRRPPSNSDRRERDRRERSTSRIDGAEALKRPTHRGSTTGIPIGQHLGIDRLVRTDHRRGQVARRS